MEPKTVISIDTNIIITNYRIFLIPDEEERKWVLHIRDVQVSDRVSYVLAGAGEPFDSSRLVANKRLQLATTRQALRARPLRRLINGRAARGY